MGLSLSVTCAAESLVFYFLPQILQLGIRCCIHLVFAAFLLRLGLYSGLQYAPSPWMVSWLAGWQVAGRLAAGTGAVTGAASSLSWWCYSTSPMHTLQP